MIKFPILIFRKYSIEKPHSFSRMAAFKPGIDKARVLITFELINRVIHERSVKDIRPADQ